MAVDRNGTIFVVLGQEPGLAASEDGGQTFTRRIDPPLPSGAPHGVARIDWMVTTNPNGRLYAYGFLGIPTMLPAVTVVPTGLEIAASGDGGRTWPLNTLLTLSPSTPVVDAWKSWLTFAPDGSMYLDYNSRGTGLWTTRSDDGGATWTAFSRVDAPTEAVVSVFMSPPVVLRDGTVAIAYLTDQLPGVPNAFLFQCRTLVLASSKDKGATFTRTTIRSTLPPDSVGTLFPTLVADDTNRLAVGVLGPSGSVDIQTSTDGGATWSSTSAWLHDVQAGPWMDLRAGNLTVLGYATGGIERATAPFGSVSPVATLVNGTSDWIGGDFLYFARGPEGSIEVPFASQSNPGLQLLRLPQ